MGAFIFVVRLVVVAMVLVFAGVKTGNQGTNWTIERFGRTPGPVTRPYNSSCPSSDTNRAQDEHAGAVLDIPPQRSSQGTNASVPVGRPSRSKVIDAARAAYEVQNLHSQSPNMALTTSDA